MVSHQSNKKRLSKLVPQGRVPPQDQTQCEVQVREKQGIEIKTSQGKSMVSPSLINAYIQIKARMREKQLREKHNGGSQ